MPAWVRQLQAQPTAQAAASPWGAPLTPPASAAPAPLNMPAYPGYAAAPQPAPGHVSAAGWVSEDALPEWLRTADVGAAGAPPPANGAAASHVQSWPAAPAASFGALPAAPHVFGPPPAAAPYGSAPLPPYSPQAASSFDVSAQQTTRQATPGAATPFPAASPFAPAEPPGTYGVPHPQSGTMPAQALYDAAAIPPWLGGRADAPAVAGTDGYAPSEGMAANSLIDERALPQWLHAEPDGTSPSPGSAASAGASPTSASAIPHWETTSAAEEPLPTWLGDVYSGTEADPSSAALAAQRGSIPASQFVDDAALPNWLKAQGGIQRAEPAAMPAPQPSAGAPVDETARVPAPRASTGQGSSPASGPAAHAAPYGFSASDLIEPGALPPWAMDAQAPAPTFSSSTGWTQQPAGPMPTQAYTGWDTPGNASASAAPPPWVTTSSPAAPTWDRSQHQWADPAGRAQDRSGAASGLANHELPPWLQDDGVAEGDRAYSPQDSAHDTPRAYAPDPAGGYAGQGTWEPDFPPAAAGWAAPGGAHAGFEHPYAAHGGSAPYAPYRRADTYDQHAPYERQYEGYEQDELGAPYSQQGQYGADNDPYAAGYDEDSAAGDDATDEPPRRRGWRRFFGRG